jgi:endonuclease IV
MTLDEKIALEREMAQQWRDEAEGQQKFKEEVEKGSKGKFSVHAEYISYCQECAEEHEQLAAWLTELKELKARPSREAVEKDELEDYQRGYHKGLKVGKRIGAREERKTIIAYIEGKTIEEDQIEQMIKNGEVEAIPYLGETAEEEPNT